MPKFTFICEHRDYHTDELDTKTTVEFNKENLYDVVEEFERFLKGAGFVFEGQLEFTKDDSDLYDNTEIDLSKVNDSFDIKLDDLDFGEAQPTLNVGLDDFEIKIESDSPTSTAWPFPVNERPQ